MTSSTWRQFRPLPSASAAHRIVCQVIACVFVLTSGSVAMALSVGTQFPDHWGGGATSIAAYGSPAAPAAQPESTPGPQELMLIPRGRLTVGSGTVDPARYLQQRGALASTYVVKAPQAGIVEYLYPRQGFFAAGFPLVRLYDLGIIPDIAKAEAAARQYLDQPFTIAGPEPAPADFPSPTVTPELAAALSQARPAARPQQDQSSNPGGLQRQQPATGLKIERAQATVARTDVTDEKKTVAQLTEQLQALQSQLTAKRRQQEKLQGQLEPLKETLAQAAADLEARESLYERGILAANALKTARDGHQKLQAELKTLHDQSSHLVADISGLEEQQHQLEASLRQARAAAASKPEVPAAPAQGGEAPRRSQATASQSRPPTATPGDARQHNAQPDFPAPTVSPLEPAITSRAEALGRSAQRLNDHERQTERRRRVELAPIPEALTRLGEPRWETTMAPTGGVITEQLVADGEQVAQGSHLLRVANSQWARIYADLSPDHLGQYRQGSPVVITFDDYPDARFEGWVSSLSPTDDGQTLRAELYVLCTGGYWGTDAYAMLRWLAGAAPVEHDPTTGMEPATETVPEVYTGHYSVYALLPIVPAQYGPARATTERIVPGQYVGHMRVAQLEAAAQGASASSEDAKQRLERLARWRESFTEGMTTTIFANQFVLTYPAEGEMRRAVEKMATGQVSNVRNRCARTLAEALGWGLGDAAQWASGLPHKGYKMREDGLCRPGDLLVWPFTFGADRTQHVGIAVLQGGRMMMLSNLSGRLGTSEILPGYLAFHKPAPTDSE